MNRESIRERVVQTQTVMRYECVAIDSKGFSIEPTRVRHASPDSAKSACMKRLSATGVRAFVK